LIQNENADTAAIGGKKPGDIEYKTALEWSLFVPLTATERGRVLSILLEF